MGLTYIGNLVHAVPRGVGAVEGDSQMSRCAKRVFSHPRSAAPLALLASSDATIIKALRTELASNPGAWSHYQRNKTTITLIMSQLAALIKKNQIDGACGWLDTIAKQCLDGQATNLHLDGPVRCAARPLRTLRMRSPIAAAADTRASRASTAHDTAARRASARTGSRGTRTSARAHTRSKKFLV